jgi:hypothetical protein
MIGGKYYPYSRLTAVSYVSTLRYISNLWSSSCQHSLLCVIVIWQHVKSTCNVEISFLILPNPWPLPLLAVKASNHMFRPSKRIWPHSSFKFSQIIGFLRFFSPNFAQLALNARPCFLVVYQTGLENDYSYNDEVNNSEPGYCTLEGGVFLTQVVLPWKLSSCSLFSSLPFQISSSSKWQMFWVFENLVRSSCSLFSSPCRSSSLSRVTIFLEFPLALCWTYLNCWFPSSNGNWRGYWHPCWSLKNRASCLNCSCKICKLCTEYNIWTLEPHVHLLYCEALNEYFVTLSQVYAPIF